MKRTKNHVADLVKSMKRDKAAQATMAEKARHLEAMFPKVRRMHVATMLRASLEKDPDTFSVTETTTVAGEPAIVIQFVCNDVTSADFSTMLEGALGPVAKAVPIVCMAYRSTGEVH